MLLTDALAARRSTRRFADAPIDAGALTAVLSAAQGHHADGRRTTPSAGGRYPLSLRVAVARVDGAEPGVHSVDADGRLADLDPGSPLGRSPNVGKGVGEGDGGRDGRLSALAAAALGDQQWIADAAAAIAIVGTPSALESGFADQPPSGRWQRYLWIECGAAAQNAGLAAAATGLGLTLVAGFDDDDMARMFAVDPQISPVLALLVVGAPADGADGERP